MYEGMRILYLPSFLRRPFDSKQPNDRSINIQFEFLHREQMKLKIGNLQPVFMIEMTFRVFHLVLLYVLNNITNVFSWELLESSKKLGKEWTEELAGQNICDDKYSFKERYYVCYEATKILRKKPPLLNRLELGADSELRSIRCRESRVYFSYKRNGTYGFASRMLYQCPIADPDSNMFLFGQGKNRNEIGVYNKVFNEEGDMEIWFYGVMKDINLDTFGKQLYRKSIKLIH